MHKQTKLTSKRVLLFGGIWTILAAVLLLGTAPLPTHADHGPFVIDGDLSDWGERYRLDLGPVNGVSGYALYATYDPNTADYLFAVRAPVAIGATTTLWLNTDQNPATGYQVSGFAGGAEFNINIFGDGQPYLYTGADGQIFTFGPLSHAYNAGNTIVEMAVPAAQLGGIATDIDIIADVNNAVFLPSDYINPPYTLLSTPLPERTNFDKRVGIVYSQTTAENFWDEKSYAQLYASVQHQVMMAGIPFDLIHEDALADYTNLINYDALIFPYYNSVDMDTTVSGDFAYLAQLETSLNHIVYNYGIGLIVAGDFMTNDRNDAPISADTYRRHQNLLGLQLEAYAGPVNYEIRANTVAHPVMQAYTADELILPYAMQYYNVYEPFAGQAITSLAQLVDTTNSQTYDGMIATETGGRNIHFGTTQIMADRNLLWRAVQWVVYGNERVLELQLGRFDSIFLSRNDMDQTQFIEEVPFVVEPLYDNYLVDWKNTYNFVGSYYINIGADLPPDDPNCYVGAPEVANPTYPGLLACTDWDLSRPLYLDYIALGNEVASHSYTHLPDTLYFPANTLNSLTPAERLFELRDSMAVIAAGLSVPVVGAAQPGDPEALFVTEEIDTAGYMDYFSGGYSSVGAGFPSAFGYLSPDYTTVYLAPNMTFDFSLVVFQGMTPAEAEAYWQQEFHNLTTHGSQPIIHWPWHDYALTVELPTYSEAMFTSLLNTAYTANTEFTTAADAAERITAFRNASLTVSPLSAGNELTATVDAADVGRSSLKLETGSDVIAHVDNWYAYNDDHIFLPQNGGTFRAQLGATADAVTHITHLPMRAELLSLVGDGTELTYTFNGEGAVVLELNIPPNAILMHEGADSVNLVGNIFTMQFDDNAAHTGRVYFVAIPEVHFSAAGYVAAEQTAEVAITATLGITPTLPVTVTVASADGTAVAGSDYAAVNQTLHFAIGQTSQTFTTTLFPDGLVEGSEQFSLILSAPHNALMGTPNPAIVTITDMPVDLAGDVGAWHHLGNLYLGGEISADAAPTTLGDDGAVRTLNQIWSPGATPTVTVTVSGTGSGQLVVWMDWDNSMAYDAPNERVIFQPVMGGNSYPILLTIPAEYPTGQQVRVRARVYDASPATPAPLGYGGGGEVEDFLWNFSPTAVALQQIAASPTSGRVALWLGAMLLLGLVSLMVLRPRRPH